VVCFSLFVVLVFVRPNLYIFVYKPIVATFSTESVIFFSITVHAAALAPRLRSAVAFVHFAFLAFDKIILNSSCRHWSRVWLMYFSNCLLNQFHKLKCYFIE